MGLSRFLASRLLGLVLLGCTLLAGATKCDFDFKVYVYPLAATAPTLPSVRLAEEARRNSSFHVCVGCIYEQFALEFIMQDFFTQFCGRTHNPHEADFFYLPIVRDIEFRVQKLIKNNKQPTMTEHALIKAIEKNDTKLWKKLFQVTDHFWHRHGGSDHIIVMPAPVTNLRHESSRRGFFHYMPQLHTPIFLNIEYSKTFVAEYPMCSQNKNVVMPYPSVDPAIINNKVQKKRNFIAKDFLGINNAQDSQSNSSNLPSRYNRALLLFYRGGNHGECMVVRQALTRVVNNMIGKSRVGGGRLSASSKHQTGYINSVFCPVPVGDSPSSKRMYDALHVGCIPVILSDDLVWAYSSATGGNLLPHHFSLSLPQKVVLVSVLQLYQSAVLGNVDNHDVEETAGGAADVLKSLSNIYLPVSKVSIRHLVDLAIAEATSSPSHNSSDNGGGNGSPITMSTNALVAILRLIPPQDIARLQENVENVAPSYQFYSRNSSQLLNPLVDNILPLGGAIYHMTQQLSTLKRRGIVSIGEKCKDEKAMKHKYIGNYPCDKVDDVSLGVGGEMKGSKRKPRENDKKKKKNKNEKKKKKIKLVLKENEKDAAEK